MRHGQNARTHPFLSRFVVRWQETRQHQGHAWLVLENVTAGMALPAALDLKIGTRTYGEDATPEKVKEQTAKVGG